MTDRMPPHDLDSEESVIGSCLIDSDAITKIPFLLPEHFYRDKNQWVFQAIRELEKRGDAINQITVSHELDRMDKLKVMGGSAYLSNTIMNVPTSVHVDHYAKIVWRLAGARELITKAGLIADMAYAAPSSISDTISESENMLSALRNDFGDEDENTVYHDEGVYEWIAIQQDQRIKPWMTTPWAQFNELVKIRNGQVTTFAADTSHGKTKAVDQIAIHTAKTLGKNVTVLHNELEPWDYMNRRACQLVDLGNGFAPSIDQLESGSLASSDEIAQFAQDYIAWPGKITMVDVSGMDVHRICSEIKLKAQQGLADLVIVDYIQLVIDDPTKRKRNDTKATEVGDNIKLLKATCRGINHKPPLVIVSQVTYDARSLTKDDLDVNNLRDSRAIGQYSNVVVFIFSPWKATKGNCALNCDMNRNQDKTKCSKRCAYFLIRKNTQGKIGEVVLTDIPHRFMFVDQIVDSNYKL